MYPPSSSSTGGEAGEGDSSVVVSSSMSGRRGGRSERGAYIGSPQNSYLFGNQISSVFVSVSNVAIPCGGATSLPNAPIVAYMYH